jgi:NADH-quinone oxidoreductase subunit N
MSYTLLFQQYNILFKKQNLNFGDGDLYYYLPDILIYITFFILLLVLCINYNKNNSIDLMLQLSKISIISFKVIFSVLVLQITYMLFSESAENNIGLFTESTLYIVNLYTQVNKLTILIIITFLFSYIPVFNNNYYYNNSAELPLLLYLNVALSFIIISANNYIILILALEGFSLILYIIATIDRSQGGIIAAAKYYAFGTLGSVFLLWGVVHLYMINPSLTYASVEYLYNIGLLHNIISLNNSLEFSSTLLLTGLLIKLGAAPLHQWVVDVYAGVHILITAFFSTIVKWVLFIVFCRVAIIVNNSSVLDIFALFSLIGGTLMTIKQLEIKRFLAYSSITHVGFLLIGDMTASIIYMLTYICATLLFFSVILAINSNNKELVYFSDLVVLKTGGYFLPFIFIISLLSMAGLPPLAGFFGKLLIWESLIEDMYLFNDFTSYILFLVSLGLSLVIIYYYVKLILYIFVDNDENIYSQFASYSTINQELSNFTVFQHRLLLSFFISCWIFVHSTVSSIIIAASYYL